MAWNVIAQSDTAEGLKNVRPAVTDLKPGDIGLVKFRGKGWAEQQLLRLFDFSGTELWAKYMVPAHTVVENAWYEDGWAYIQFRVTGTPVWVILAAIAAVLLSLGILVVSISVAIWGPEQAEAITKWIALGAVGVVALVFLSKKGVKA